MLFLAHELGLSCPGERRRRNGEQQKGASACKGAIAALMPATRAAMHCSGSSTSLGGEKRGCRAASLPNTQETILLGRPRALLSGRPTASLPDRLGPTLRKALAAHSPKAIGCSPSSTKGKRPSHQIGSLVGLSQRQAVQLPGSDMDTVCGLVGGQCP